MKKLALVFAVVLTLGLVSSVSAMCPPGDLFCQYWSVKDQQQKNRILTMDNIIATHAALLAGCDSACQDNYNTAARGLLKKLSDKKGLPYDKVVLTAISLAWDWGNQATDAYKRPLVQADWNKHASWGLNELTATLNENPLLRIWDDGVYCVNQEYDGVCPGLW